MSCYLENYRDRIHLVSEGMRYRIMVTGCLEGIALENMDGVVLASFDRRLLEEEAEAYFGVPVNQKEVLLFHLELLCSHVQAHRIIRHFDREVKVRMVEKGLRGPVLVPLMA